jgi:hypothetical protein
MGTVKRLIIALSLMAPITSQATQQWSSCQTVTGVSNYIAFGNQVIIALSPGLPCSVPVGVPGGVSFVIGTNGITANNINTFLASALSAYATGQRVQLYYDDAACGGLIISNGGITGQCN